jgi:hypothetical protein
METVTPTRWDTTTLPEYASHPTSTTIHCSDTVTVYSNPEKSARKDIDSHLRDSCPSTPISRKAGKNVLEWRPEPTPENVAGKLMCVKCTHWFSYGTAEERKAFRVHVQTCREGRCMRCGLVMRAERLFKVHRELCWEQMNGVKNKRSRGQRGSRGKGGSRKKKMMEQKITEKMEERDGRKPEVLVDYELPEGYEHMDWDTDHLRRAFGDIE